MRRWRIVEPGPDGQPVVTEWTEAEILAVFWPYWQKQMTERGKLSEISEENCIMDWVTVNWAEPVREPDA